MPGRVIFVLVVLALCGLRALVTHYSEAFLPQTMSAERLAAFAVPGILISGTAILLAVRWRVFTRVELGLAPTDWQLKYRVTGFRLALFLLGLFLVFALMYALPPINYAYSQGLSHAEFLEELRRFEYRSTLEAYEPIDAAGLALSFFDGSVHAPLAEEVPYRALLVPLVRPWIGRFGTALCSGVVFFLLHWLVYGLGPEPSHFFSGAIFAYLFMYAGLGASLAAHAGGNAGIWLLAVYAAFAAE